MTCQELERVIYPYLDGEFQPQERLEVEAHLSGCEACARLVHTESQMRLALRRAARHAVHSARAPDSLRMSLQQGLRREQRQEFQARWVRWGAAALVVLTCGGMWAALKPSEQQRFLEDAARLHDKNLPYEISVTTPEHVERWFRGKLDHRVPVPRLPNAELKGGRLSNVTDRPAAYISYERNAGIAGVPAKRIGLFVFDDARRDVAAEPLPLVEVGSSRGYNVAMWRDGEIVYELVTDLEESDIRQMLSSQAAQHASPTTVPAALPVQPVSLP